MDDMYEKAISGAKEMLGAEAAMIMLVDHEKQELYSRTATITGGYRGLENIRSPFGEGIMGRVATSGTFMNIQDLTAPENQHIYDAERHNNYRGTGIEVRSVLCMPIFGKNENSGKADRVVGVVEVLNKKKGRYFTEHDEDALAALCSHMSTSLSFVDGEEHGFDYTLEMCERFLCTKGTRINAAQNHRVKELYEAVLVEVSELVHAESVQLVSVDVDSHDCELLAELDIGSRQLEQDQVPPSWTSDASRMIRHFSLTSTERSSLSGSLVEEAVRDREPKFGVGGYGFPARACCPIFDSRSEVIGAIQVCRKSTVGRFSDEERQLLSDVASQVARAMESSGSSLNRVLLSLESIRKAT